MHLWNFVLGIYINEGSCGKGKRRKMNIKHKLGTLVQAA
uniref:Uncharacterized protein n=1 Tax=Anguilla anguilla TaxID=7936 RepID=A0A0E9TP29_ANGAN